MREGVPAGGVAVDVRKGEPFLTLSHSETRRVIPPAPLGLVPILQKRGTDCKGEPGSPASSPRPSILKGNLDLGERVPRFWGQQGDVRRLHYPALTARSSRPTFTAGGVSL